MSTRLLALTALAVGAITVTSVAAFAAVEPTVTEVGSSVAARSTDGAGLAINYTDGRWYNANGTPVVAKADGPSVAPPAALEPTVTEVGSSVAARSTDSASLAIYYTDGRWYYANGTPVR